MRVLRCTLLRGGILQAVRVPTVAEERHRELVRTRDQLVRARRRADTQLRAKLLLHDIALPEELRKASWGDKLLCWFEHDASPGDAVGIALGALVRVARDLTHEIDALDVELERASKAHDQAEAYARLRAAPGVGALTAAMFISEIGDPNRFERAEQLSSWLGLTPSEYSSGDRQHRGRITRTGNKRLRSQLVEISWLARQGIPALDAVYERIKQRAGGKRAVVAVARRLATILWRMWRDGTEWDPSRLSVRQAS